MLALALGALLLVVAAATAPLDVMRPQPGWSEQDPDAWAPATFAAMDALAADHPAAMAAVVSAALVGRASGTSGGISSGGSLLSVGGAGGLALVAQVP
jgi:xylulokinase